jgi:hypothetical protein
VISVVKAIEMVQIGWARYRRLASKGKLLTVAVTVIARDWLIDRRHRPAVAACRPAAYRAGSNG